MLHTSEAGKLWILLEIRMIPHGSTPEEQARWQKAEYDTWGPLIKRIGFSAES